MRPLLALTLLASFVLAGCLSGESITQNVSSNVLYVHDDVHGVGCWYYGGGGVFCIPDKDYQR